MPNPRNHAGRRQSRAVGFGRATRRAGWIAAALAASAAANYVAARWAERKHPPRGAFIEVDGVRLRYLAKGAGRPIVLVHGNAVSGDDFATSGLFDALAADHRVIAFDRPGFGYSSRPPHRDWSAAAQADLLARACADLGLNRPVVVAHSWGTFVALNLALRHREVVGGLVLMSGYYLPSLRLDSLLVAPAAAPVLGPLLRHTVSPIFGRLMTPGMLRLMFSPSSVPAGFRSAYSAEMAVRPSQLAASAAEGARMVREAKQMQSRARELSLPVLLIAGRGDRIISYRQIEKFSEQLPQAEAVVIENAGHMVHHVATQAVASAISRFSAAHAPVSSEVGQPRPGSARHLRAG